MQYFEHQTPFVQASDMGAAPDFGPIISKALMPWSVDGLGLDATSTPPEKIDGGTRFQPRVPAPTPKAPPTVAQRAQGLLNFALPLAGLVAGYSYAKGWGAAAGFFAGSGVANAIEGSFFSAGFDGIVLIPLTIKTMKKRAELTGKKVT